MPTGGALLALAQLCIRVYTFDMMILTKALGLPGRYPCGAHHLRTLCKLLMCRLAACLRRATPTNTEGMQVQTEMLCSCGQLKRVGVNLSCKP